MTAESITCPRCGMTSHHPTDVAEGYCGNCHDWTSPRGGDPEPTPEQRRGLRFRLYVRGELVAEDWLTPGNAETTEATARRHGARADQANEAGDDWVLEVWDPDYPDEPLRIGPESFVEAEVVVEIGLVPPGFRRTYANPN